MTTEKESKKKEIDAKKALEKNDKKWKNLHGINRQDHNRLLLAGYHDDFSSNEEWYMVMKIHEAIRTKKKQKGEEE